MKHPSASCTQFVTDPVTEAATIVRMPNPEWFQASKSPTPVRQPKPGEALCELEIDGTRYRCELRDFGEFGMEAQMLVSGELWQSCRFFGRVLAVRWAEGIRERNRESE
jgi:hypothetical protein